MVSNRELDDPKFLDNLFLVLKVRAVRATLPTDFSKDERRLARSNIKQKPLWRLRLNLAVSLS